MRLVRPLLSAGALIITVIVIAAARQKADPPGSSDILALLPDGEMKRSFILDCTGCHQLDSQRAFPGGAVRSAAEWQQAIVRMLDMAGPSTGFPVISDRVRPDELARWLAESITRVPEGAERTPNDGAVLREYEFPHASDLPHDLMVNDAGSIVITGMFTHRMHVLEPESGRFTEVPIPRSGANPRAIDIDSAGRWWVLLGGPRQVGEYDPRTQQWRFHDIGMYPHSVRADARGRVWFNGHFTNAPERVGYINAASGAIRLFDLATPPALASGAGPIPYGLRVAPDGSVWGSELQGNRIFRLDPERGEFRTWTMPMSHSGPRRIDVGPDGIVWIPAYGADRLVRFDPRTGEFTTIELPHANVLPYVVRVDQQRGTVWIGTAAGDVVLSYDPAQRTFEEYPLPTRGALVRHIDIDMRTGALWAAYGASPGIPPRILRLAPR